GVTHLARGGSGVVTDVSLADGTQFHLRYDWLERLVSVDNALGERHTFELDAYGVVCRECTFDGRDIRYERDALGRIVRPTGDAEGGARRRDARGRVVQQTYEDGRVERFSYAARGHLVTAEGAHATVYLERAALGRVVRERMDVDGEQFAVHTELDVLG